jgi:hypothetical protein
MDPTRRIRSILLKYVSPITGEAIVAAGLRAVRLGAGDLRAANLARLVRALDQGIELFVAEGRRPALRAELAALAPDLPAPLTVEVCTEADVERARALASALCERLGARPSATWKVSSGVVALASRLASRRSCGVIEMIPLDEAPHGVRVRAVDGDKNRTAQPHPSGPPPARTRPSLPPEPAAARPRSSAPPPRAGASVPPPRAGASVPPGSPSRPRSNAPPHPPARPRPSAPPPNALDGALPTLRCVADRFDVSAVGNRTHVEFDVWFAGLRR